MRNLTGLATRLAESFGFNGTASGVFYKGANQNDPNTPGSIDTNGTGTLGFDASRQVTTATEFRPTNACCPLAIYLGAYNG